MTAMRPQCRIIYLSDFTLNPRTIDWLKYMKLFERKLRSIYDLASVKELECSASKHLKVMSTNYTQYQQNPR